MKRLLRCALPLTVAMLFAPSHDAHAAGTAPIRVVDRLALGGPGGWDYLAVDAAHRHLFISRSSRVEVLDLTHQKRVGTIAGTDGVHGVAIAPDRNEGFTSNGRSASVTVFDLSTLKTLATIPGTGKNPDAIVYDSASHHVLTMNGRSASASVIDPASRKVIATIALPGKPEFAQADGAGHIYVNIENTSELVEIDSLHDTVLHTWSLAPCKYPSGLALDTGHHRLFSVCDNQTMAVTDAESGKVVATVPIGEGPDAVAFDSATDTVYSSNGESGTITVVHENDPDHYAVTATVPTQVSARTEALDPVSHRLFLSAAKQSPKKNARGWHEMVPNSYTLLVVGQR